MLVVADSGPLIALSDVGRLELLLKLYRDVWIPPEVSREAFEAHGRTRPDWIHVGSSSAAPAELAGANLGPGETQAIALAIEKGADLLLADDRRARRLAQHVGLLVAGTVAVLLRATWLSS